MAFMQLEEKGAVYVLTLTNGDKDNTFNPDVLAEYHACLDQIEADRSDAALLICSSHPKTFCNGIDLPWLQTQNADGFNDFVIQLENFLLRMAILDLPVIAAINGNVLRWRRHHGLGGRLPSDAMRTVVASASRK
jgi:enoyl-CoA hydratase/carnithine racemase